MTDMPGSDAPLTAETFNTCASVLRDKVDAETPTPRTPDGGVIELNPEDVRQIQVFVSQQSVQHWLDRALDGEPGKLAAIGDTPPWEFLRTERADLGDAMGVLETINGRLTEDWSGTAADDYASYMLQLRDRVKNHVGETSKEGYLAEVAALTEAAFAVELAYKKDLLELARNTGQALDKLDSGGDAMAQFGALCLAFGGLALGALSAVTAGTAVVGLVVLASIESTAGGFMFSKATEMLQVKGESADSIMKSMDEALGRITSSYAGAAKQVSGRIDTLLQDITAASDESKFPTVPKIDAKHPGTFMESNFFPKSASGNKEIEGKIEHLPTK